MSSQPSSPPDCSAAAAALAHYFENLSQQSVAEVARYYAADARFKDPFNEVSGTVAIQQIFEHMFDALEQPRFVITQQLVQGQQCCMTWEFRFGFRKFKRGQTQVILGATHLVFSASGQVRLHRDYWDAAEELYEKLPLLAGLMRWLRHRARS